MSLTNPQGLHAELLEERDWGPETVIAGRYELRSCRCRGGMAEVWEAVDQRLQRPVAVKLLTRDAFEEDQARFAREALIAAQFAHPNTVTIYDAGTDNETRYLVMEFVEGPTLAEVLSRRGSLQPGEAVAIADQVLAAIGAGHQAGLVHCDIKPSNILLRGSSESFDELSVCTGWTVKLADFGASKGAGEPVTVGSQIQITPRYTSPEQVAGRPATAASDLYAVGVVLFEMLSGELPFVRDTPLATAAAHCEAPVPSLLARRPELAPDLVAVVERALAKESEARAANTAAMRRCLASALRGDT